MKTLRIILFFILGMIFTFQSFAQEVKKEKKAKFRMEVIDDNGNTKIVDTTFTLSPGQDYEKIIHQIKKQAGYYDEEISKMKHEIKAHVKHIDLDVVMDQFDKEGMREHMMIVREELNEGKESLQEAMEQLKVEIESLKMNEEAMKKLEKAMEELHKIEWAEHANHLKIEMENLHKHFEDGNFFIKEGKHGKKHVWVDQDGEKRIIIKMDIDGDSLINIHEDHELFFMDDDMDKDIWIEKEGKKINIKKLHKDGNAVFFGNEKDLERIEEIDGEHRIIVRKLKGEAAKGDVMFISDDAHVVKEFKDKDGRVKVMRYEVKSGDKDAANLKYIIDIDEEYSDSNTRNVFMISSASESEIAKAFDRGLTNEAKNTLELNNINLELEDELLSIGTSFAKKGTLLFSLYDEEMNKVWEKKEEKVKGEWSTVIPVEILKEKGKYYLLFDQKKKTKMYTLITK